MLVFDFKTDETLAKVQQWAREAGRESDVQELSPASGFYYELISENFTLDHIDELVEKIASVAPLTNPQDGFWWQIRDNLLDAALVILRVTSERMDFRTATNFIGRWLLNPGMSADPDGRIRQFEAILRDVREQLDDKWRNKLDGTKSVIQMWQGLDSRTRGIVAATLSNCLKPLLGLRAQSYFEPAGRQPLDLRALVEQGKIIVVRVNAAADPPLAQLIGKLIKADFYRLAQERQLTYEDSGRLIGLLMDEYQLAVTGDGNSYSDIPQLGTLRSKRAFIIAATQGFVCLDNVIGERSRDSLLVNFNNLFFFNSHEVEVDRFAQVHFGTVLRRIRTAFKGEDFHEEGEIAVHERQRMQAFLEEYVCPSGRLSRLETNQAYVSLARGRKYIEPVWIQPVYFTVPIGKVLPENTGTDDAMAVISAGRAKVSQAKKEQTSGPGDIMETMLKQSGEKTPLPPDKSSGSTEARLSGSRDNKEPVEEKPALEAVPGASTVSPEPRESDTDEVSGFSPEEIYRYYSTLTEDDLEVMAFDAIRWLDGAETRAEAEKQVVKMSPFFLDCTFPRLPEDLKQALRDTLDRAEKRFGSLAEVLGLDEADSAKD